MAGRRIDDHKSWVGSAPKGQVFPAGPHKTKMESSAEGSGALSKYEDTTEAIKATQNAGDSKIKGHAQRPGYRY